MPPHVWRVSALAHAHACCARRQLGYARCNWRNVHAAVDDDTRCRVSLPCLTGTRFPTAPSTLWCCPRSTTCSPARASSRQAPLGHVLPAVRAVHCASSRKQHVRPCPKGCTRQLTEPLCPPSPSLCSGWSTTWHAWTVARRPGWWSTCTAPCERPAALHAPSLFQLLAGGAVLASGPGTQLAVLSAQRAACSALQAASAAHLSAALPCNLRCPCRYVVYPHKSNRIVGDHLR